MTGNIIPKGHNSPDFDIQMELWVKDWISMLNHINLDKKVVLKNLRASNPYVIPRNHQIEKIIQKSVFSIQEGNFDFTAFENLARVCSTPFKKHTNAAKLILPPSASEKVYETFCGT